MAGREGVTRLLARHRAALVRELDTNRLLPTLVSKEIISKTEEKQILDIPDPSKRTETLLDILAKRGLGAFHDFCSCLEKFAPHLLTGFLLDNQGQSPNDKNPTQALQLGFELALKERDAMLRENAKAVEERDQAIRQLQLLKSERDSALASLENITGKPSKNTNSRSDLSPSTNRKVQKNLERSSDMDQETDLEDIVDNVAWETHTVVLKRVPGFGFGIAVSGGRDNPHFANGDPSIAISDVLTAGPAEGKLLINDRVMSVNGHSLENVDHSTAIAVLKESGNRVNLVIKRRVVVPSYAEPDNAPIKITLNRKNRREDFGVILGCKYFIKEITGNSLAAQDGGLKEGDTVLKINSTPIEHISLVDARKLMEKSKEKLQLLVTKKRYELSNKAQDDEYSLGYGTLQGTLPTKRPEINDVNIYRPSLSSPDEEMYKGNNYQEVPAGSYPGTEHSRFDGRYIYDHEAPPRPPLPDDADAPPRPPSPGKELLRPDDFYSPRSPRTPHSPAGAPDGYMSDQGMPRPDQVDRGMHRRHHDERYIGKRKDIVLDPRFVYFEKEPEFGLGLRLAGGNATGIFIASVQPGSGAEAVGLIEGDQILKANDAEIPGMTREDAVTYLTSLEGRVSMVVQYKKEEYDKIMASHEAGDSFYIRTHFEYQQKEQGELSFTIGDIFHVKDTLFRGVVGSWLSLRIGRTNQETQKGIIPNKNRAEQLFLSTNQPESEKENTPTKSRSLIFKRKSARRSKSLSKDHWEDVIFSNLQTKFAAYERVVLREPGFMRPVVIFGALADVAREKILHDFPELFESPQGDNDGANDQKKSGIIRLGAIKEIINKKKHCVLDVTPHNVDKLNYAQYYPIVVYLKAENKNIVKECRAKFAKNSSKNPKKLFEQSQKLEKMYPHLFTATISHNSTDIWYQRVVEMIHLQQNQQIWMSEQKPEDNVNDDFLFPMSSKGSFTGNQESDHENSKTYPEDFDASPKHKKRLVRSSSDPSINTTDKVPGIPPYPAPPSYHRSPIAGHKGMLDDRRYVDIDRQSEDRYYPSYYASESLPHGQFPHGRSNIDPYATITPHERLRSQIPEDGQWYNPAYGDDRGPDRFNPDYRRSEPDLGRHNHNRPSTSSLPPPQPHLSHDASQRHPHQPFQENSSSYSSDSYSRYTSNPVNRHDDSKLREKFGSLAVAAKGEKGISHDPYRFTRSTANPVNTANVDKSKLSDLSARYRKEDPPPSRKQSQPQSQNAPVPSHHSSQSGAPERVKKEPPPVPVKTYNLRDRGIEPDDLKIRNYENSNRAYNYADPAGYPSQPNDQKNQYSDHSENPYDYVMPRQGYQRSRTSPNQNSQYARPNVNPQHHVRENSRDRGRVFMNQIYMDTEQLQKLRARQENASPGSMGNRDVGVRDSGYPSPDRPRTNEDLIQNSPPTSKEFPILKSTFSSYKNLIIPGFYGAKTSPGITLEDLREQSRVSHDHSDRERSSHDPSDSDDHGSAFEAYKKPVMSTFGKAPGKGPSPNMGFEATKHISDTSSPDNVENCTNQNSSHDTSSENEDQSHDKTDLDPARSTAPAVDESQTSDSDTDTIIENRIDPLSNVDIPLEDGARSESLSSTPTDELLYRSKELLHSNSNEDVPASDGRCSDSSTPTQDLLKSSMEHMKNSPTDDMLDTGLMTYNRRSLGEKDVGHFLEKASENQILNGLFNKQDKEHVSSLDIQNEGVMKPAEGPPLPKTSPPCLDDVIDGNLTHNPPLPLNPPPHAINDPSVEEMIFIQIPPLPKNPPPGLNNEPLLKNVKEIHSPVMEREPPSSRYDRKGKDISARDQPCFDRNERDARGQPHYKTGHVTSGDPSNFGREPHYKEANGEDQDTSARHKSYYERNENMAKNKTYYNADEKEAGGYSHFGKDHVTLRELPHETNEYKAKGHSNQDRNNESIKDGNQLLNEKDSFTSSQDLTMTDSPQLRRKEHADAVIDIPKLIRDPPPNLLIRPIAKNPHENMEKKVRFKTSMNGSLKAGHKPFSFSSSKGGRQLQRRTIAGYSETSSNRDHDDKADHNPQRRSFGGFSGSLSNMGQVDRTSYNAEQTIQKRPFTNNRDTTIRHNGDHVKLQEKIDPSHDDLILIDFPPKRDTVLIHKESDQPSHKTDQQSRKLGSNAEENTIVNGDITSMRSSDAEKLHSDMDTNNSENRVSVENKINEKTDGQTRFETLIDGETYETTVHIIDAQTGNKYVNGLTLNKSRGQSSKIKQARKETLIDEPVNNANKQIEELSNNNVSETQSLETSSANEDPTMDGDYFHSVNSTNDASNNPPSATVTEGSAHRSELTNHIDGQLGESNENIPPSEIVTMNGPDTGQMVEGNHTVVATARGVFNHEGGVLESVETGVSIVIPKGAIPEGVTQEIYFKVCKDNNILPPLDKDKGETLLSPLVMCGPHGLKFLQPVELRLPHCASVNPDSWSFALKSSDSPTGHPTQWQNMTLAGMEGVAQGRVGKNSVSVLVDHF